MNAPVKGPGGRSSRPGSCCESLSSVTWLLPRPLCPGSPRHCPPHTCPEHWEDPAPGWWDLG